MKKALITAALMLCISTTANAESATINDAMALPIAPSKPVAKTESFGGAVAMASSSYPVIKSKCLTDKALPNLNKQVYALINLFYKTPTKKDPTFGMKDDERIACNNALYKTHSVGLIGKQDKVTQMSITQTIALNSAQTKFTFTISGTVSVLSYNSRTGTYSKTARTEKINVKNVVNAF